MQSQTLCLGILVCMAVVTISVSAGKGMGGKMKKCGDGEINTEEAFKGHKECMANSTATTEAPAEETERRRRRSPEGGKGKGKKGKGWWGGKGKNMCVAVCAWKVVGLLDSDGQFSESGCEEYAKKVYPEDKQADAISKTKKCAEDHKSEFSMEEKCKGYGKFKKCVMKAHMETCGIKMGGWGKKGDKGGNKQENPPAANEEGGDEE